MKKNRRLYLLLFILFITAGLFLWHNTLERNVQVRTINPPEKNWLVEKYGAKLYSQHNEELIIRDFFNDQRNGFFVDVGASHYKINSTTYYLEEHLGWKGIAIDALSQYEEEYLKYRKNTRFYSFFVADKSDEEIDFYITLENKRLSTSRVELAKRRGKFQKVKIPTISLNDLLEKEGISQFDFLSMDIERAEPAALAGFDIKKYKPSLVCIEAHQEVLEEILDYFLKNNYKVIEKYKELDSLNLYFKPRDKKLN